MRGAEVFASQISSHMVREGHEVKIVSLADGTATLPFSGEIDSLNVNLSNKFFDWAGWKKLSGIVKEFRPDVVQANAGDTLKYAIFSRMFFGWNVPIVFRNASVISRYLKSPVAKALTGFLVRRTDRIASVSTVSSKDITALFNLSNKKVTVIPIGIESAEVRKLASFENGKKNIVHVGGFSFEKNHGGLIRIFEQCMKKDQQLMLWLIGEGPLKEKVKAEVAARGLRERVIFTGHVNNPMDHILSADLCVLPSIIEGLPGVVAESFYCRTPVVAYEVGGIKDLVENGKNGWLIEQGNEHAFADKMMEVLKMDTIMKTSVTDAAYKTVTQNFRNEVIALRFIDLYKSLQPLK